MQPIFLGLLRVAHITSGVVWTGGTLFLAFLVEPWLRNRPGESQKFLARPTIPYYLGGFALATLLFGAELWHQYYEEINTFGTGTVIFYLAGVTGLLAFLNNVGQAATLRKIREAQSDAHGRLLGSFRRQNVVNVVLLTVTLFGMEFSRFLA